MVLTQINANKKMCFLENDQLCIGKPIQATDSYVCVCLTHTHTRTTVKNTFQIYLLDLKEPITVGAVYLAGCSPHALGLSITDTHLSM